MRLSRSSLRYIDTAAKGLGLVVVLVTLAPSCGGRERVADCGKLAYCAAADVCCPHDSLCGSGDNGCPLGGCCVGSGAGARSDAGANGETEGLPMAS
jgi:hypothetical protein